MKVVSLRQPYASALVEGAIRHLNLPTSESSVGMRSFLIHASGRARVGPAMREWLAGRWDDEWDGLPTEAIIGMGRLAAVIHRDDPTAPSGPHIRSEWIGIVGGAHGMGPYPVTPGTVRGRVSWATKELAALAAPPPMVFATCRCGSGLPASVLVTPADELRCIRCTGLEQACAKEQR